jgi:hypothetical protein
MSLSRMGQLHGEFQSPGRGQVEEVMYAGRSAWLFTVLEYSSTRPFAIARYNGFHPKTATLVSRERDG